MYFVYDCYGVYSAVCGKFLNRSIVKILLKNEKPHYVEDFYNEI